MNAIELSLFSHHFIAAENVQHSPTLLLLHGTGGDENGLLEMGRALSPNANLLSPRGLVREGAMPRWFARLGEGVFDEEDLKFRTHQLSDWLGVAAQNYHFDASQVFAVGYSNGANIAGAMLLLRPQVLAGAALLHPMVPLIPPTLPDLAGKPIFIGAGQNDPMVTTNQTQELNDLLKKCGADVSLFWHSGGHNIAPQEFAAAQKWVNDAF